ncbi:MAG: polysaccharide deacetylase family protein [Clostridia bacterium]|nr:polysaccharide deacetylase family protein [Clostridia bacterium]
MASHFKTVRRVQPGLIICLAVICALAVALCAVSIYAATTISEMRGAVTQAESQLADINDRLAQKDSVIAQQQGTIDEQKGKIEEQQGTIEEQQGTINEQKDEIADLKVQIALNNTAPGDPNLPTGGPYDDYENEKIVALTFDDGPGPYTARLLDELQARGARATFFVLGTRVDSYPKLIRRMAEEGHVVGNHSNAHNMLHRMDLVGVRNEMGKCAEKIEKLLGYRPCVMRCPGGNSSDTVKKYAEEAGIPILYWGVDTRDWESRNKDAILNIAKKNIKDGSIVLMHDIYSTTVDAAVELMDWLIAEGYTMVTVPELLEARRGGMEAGKTYS